MHDQDDPDWRPWADAPSFGIRGFEETLDGGQAFRWNKVEQHFEGRWASHSVGLRWVNGGVEYSATEVDAEKVESTLQEYFALDTNFEELTDTLPWRSDPVLKTSIQAFPGLRILKQPFGETLFGFLCSSTKQIPQIKAIHEAVASALGDPLPDGTAGLPSWAQIASAGEAPLRAAKLGYRARYIYETAITLSEQPSLLQEIEAAPTPEAREKLMVLPGVGRKIADCVLLFGAGRLDAFPIDTWVQKILSRAYGLEGWKPDQLLDFARVHFGENAGLAQQYLFAAARAGMIAK